MPSRWLLVLDRIDPHVSKPEHAHAAISRWFDLTGTAHWQLTKPYAISPLSDGPRPRTATVEVGALDEHVESAIESAVRKRATVRIGAQTGAVVDAQPLLTSTWDELATPTGARAWTLDFATPVTFRRGNRSTPLPTPAAILRGLSESWAAYGPGEPRAVPREQADAVWVSDLAGETHRFSLAQMTVNGFLGTVTLRCDDPAVAAIIDPLLRLAPYAGVGSGRAKGLGVTYLRPTSHNTAETSFVCEAK